jgi:hypothetical protein
VGVKAGKPATPRALIRYKAATLGACIKTQERIRKVLRARTLLYPDGVPVGTAATWCETKDERFKRFLIDHREKDHRCPPPICARIIELEYERRMLG